MVFTSFIRIWRSQGVPLIYLLLIACGGLATGCGNSQAKATGVTAPVSCQSNSDCPTGSMCGPTGTCTPPPSSSNGPSLACEGVSDAEKTSALQALTTTPRRCANGDDNCPCGSFCNIHGVCEADCIAVPNPPSGFTCGSGLACTPLGRCAASADTPPPSVEALTLQISPLSISANTASSAAIAAVAVTVTASSKDFITPSDAMQTTFVHPAPVLYRFQGVPDTGTPPAGSPLVQCAPGDAFAASCTLAGGWTFDVTSGSLVSASRMILVQIPKTSMPTSWTLEARSEWALTPAAAIVTAAPVTFSSSGAGHYTGTIEWVNRSSVNSDGTSTTISLPIEAIATANYVAISEPTHMVLPDGHAVLPRDTTKAVLLGWLSSGSSQYNVNLVVPFSYSAATGQLSAPSGKIVSGSSAQRLVKLSLQQTGDVGVPSCTSNSTCASGSYCEPLMNLCVPGTGPATESVVDASTAAPSNNLPSAQAAAWVTPLQTVVAANTTQLSGTGRDSFDRPYCYQGTQQTGAATFARGANILSPSNDLACNLASNEYPQPTFEFENKQKDVSTDAADNTFSLLTACTSDLDAQPTGPATAANLLAPRPCVSLGRFFLTFNSTPDDDTTYRLKLQGLRQWLGVNAYIANTTVQDQQFEDALGASGQAPQDRLAQAVDRVDRGLQLVLDPKARKYYAPDSGTASRIAPTPDYRFSPRPVARWTFNSTGTSVPNAESTDGSMPLTCSTSPVGGELVAPDSLFSYACSGSVTGVARAAGAHNVFTIVAADLAPGGLDLIVANILAQDSGFKVSESIGNPAAMSLTLSRGSGSVTFPPISPISGGSSYGLVAIVADGSTYSLMQALPNQPIKKLAPSTVIGGGADLAPSGVLQVGNVSSRDIGVGGGSLNVDELSLWDRALTMDEFAAMAAQYNFIPTNESLPPRPAIPSSGNEQAVGTGVHMLEAAAADLNLLDAYIQAERNVVYPQCLAGQHDALDGLLARAGRNLRTVSLIEDEAMAWANIPGVAAAPWFPRFLADARELDGRRIKVMSSLQNAAACKNPLGIEEEDLPLFRGNTGTTADQRFFASSAFLRAAAQAEANTAGGLLLLARQAYNQQQQSDFQEAQGEHDSADRTLKLNIDYEERLKLYCGAPPGEDVQHQVFPLLEGFRTGSIDASNCFLKLEQPECQNLTNQGLTSIPSGCLRGQMGGRVLAIQAAAVDAQNAQNAYDRALEQFDSDMQYCSNLQIKLKKDDSLLTAHLQHMAALHRQSDTFGLFVAGIAVVGGALATAVTGGAALPVVVAGAASLIDKAAGDRASEVALSSEDAYQVEKQARQHEEEIDECVHKADDEKFSIDAARDTISRAAEQTRAAFFGLADDGNTVTGIANEGAGQLAREATIDRTPPHLHYWLDQSISAYHAHMTEARRLTYLAVRAFEYEQQASTGLRGPALSAALPEDLTAVLTPIGDAISEFDQHHPIDQRPIVLSLRDELLGIADQGTDSARLPGSPPADAITRLRAFLASDASKIYDQTGRFVGHGLHFSLKPDPSMASSCNERVWRITPAVQVELAQDLARPDVMFVAANAFGSQVCGASPGTVQLARVQPSDALLVGDGVIDLPDPRPFSTTNVQPFVNMARTTLRTFNFPSDDPSAFAGRGYYGDYIIVFPDQAEQCSDALCLGYSSDVLAKIQDVLIRFDIVEENNSNL